MAEFFAELKRRQMFRVAAAYAVVAWLLLQLVNNLTPALYLPSWAATLVTVLLIVGFPIALLFCWIQHLAPADAAQSAAKTGRLDWVLIGGLAAVLLFMAYQQLAPVRQPGVDAAKQAAASPAGSISLAVLPFTNLSSDPEQEFFSDGMTEEITAALAKVPDLRVVGRTSAFEFKGQNKDLRAIGQALSATHLIEGSVRKAGERVRITVQLIKADDGTHLWSENYDRQLTDIFAVQEDIARTVTSSLNMSLGLQPGENLVNNRSIDTESYEKFLRAQAVLVARGGGTAAQEFRNYTEAATLLEGVIAKNPGYAPAWFRLSHAYAGLAIRHAEEDANIADARAGVDEFHTKAEAANQKAIQLDPNMAEPYALLAWLMRARFHPLEADEFLNRSLALDPLNSEVIWINGMLSAAAGRLKEALAIYERGHAVDPFYPNLAAATAQLRWLNGQNEAAIALAKTLRPNSRAPLLALIYASMNRYGEAADALMEVAGNSNPDAAEAARLLRMAASRPDARELPRGAKGSNDLRGLSDMIYLYLGAPDRALQTYERFVEVGHINGNRANVWHPDYAPVRKTERFKSLMRKVGLVDYWRAKGWPEFCKPVGADDFACE